MWTFCKDYCFHRARTLLRMLFSLCRFTHTIGSLGITVHKCFDSHSCDFAIQRINAVQQTKANHFAMIYCVDGELWRKIQYLINPGTTRLIKCNNIQDIVTSIVSCYQHMNDSARLMLQQEYFQDEEKMLNSSESSKEILSQLLESLGVDNDSNIHLLQEALPSLSTILNARREDLEENIPIDIASIENLVNFLLTGDNE